MINVIIQHYHTSLLQHDSKRMRNAQYPDVEAAIVTWFEQAIASKCVTINDHTIQLQAVKYATMMGHTDLKANNGCLDGFKSRHNNSYKTVVGEAGLSDSCVVLTWLKDIMQKLIENQVKETDHKEQSQEPEIVVITKKKALNHLKELRQYFMAQSNDTSTTLSKIDKER